MCETGNYGDTMTRQPLGYFITFTTYGSWLHGDRRGSILRGETTKFLPENPALRAYEESIQEHQAFVLDSEAQEIVKQTILETCRFREWLLYAAHIRSTHVHLVLKADARPERVLIDLKAYATRMLKKNGYKQPRFWTRHGSTRYLNTTSQLNKSIHYIISEQGEPMSIYLDPDLTAQFPYKPEA
jgi:REP element-mobilizing transposase RayT